MYYLYYLQRRLAIEVVHASLVAQIALNSAGRATPARRRRGAGRRAALVDGDEVANEAAVPREERSMLIELGFARRPEVQPHPLRTRRYF
jgi:hypothetical protein